MPSSRGPFTAVLGFWQRQVTASVQEADRRTRPFRRLFGRRTGDGPTPVDKHAATVVELPDPVFAPTSYHRIRLLRQGHGAGMFRRRRSERP